MDDPGGTATFGWGAEGLALSRRQLGNCPTHCRAADMTETIGHTQ